MNEIGIGPVEYGLGRRMFHADLTDVESPVSIWGAVCRGDHPRGRDRQRVLIQVGAGIVRTGGK